jgi:hypothetical protein
MLAVATEVFTVVTMLFGFGAGNAILLIATNGKARWHWHIAVWFACFLILVADVYFGAEAGMWCLSSDAVAPHMRCR